MAWIILRGDDRVRVESPVPPLRQRSRVVLLHGWLQSHTCWLQTALALRDQYAHDVLLLDFHGHGAARPAASATAMSPDAWTAQLERALADVGWDEGERVALAGVSLGAAVAMRYTCAHPERVGRLTVVAPPGLEESWYWPGHIVRILAVALCAAAPAARLLDLLRVIRTTPGYGVRVPRLIELAAQKHIKIKVFTGGCDIVHTPHERYWRAAEARYGHGVLRYELLPGRTHWGLAEGLYGLDLHHQGALWHEALSRCGPEGPVDAGMRMDPGPRARL